jgi:hypothetical protein
MAITDMKTIFYLFSFLLFTTQLHAQCVSGNCENGAGVKLLEDGSRYIGQFRNGQLEGVGTRRYPDGSSFQGQWKNGFPNGEGVQYFPDGTTIAGDWINGRYTGKNTQEFADKGYNNRAYRTTGCINGDCFNGEGVYVFSSGAIYIGSFNGGEIHGVGLCMYPDGSKYQGEWKNRYPEGKGTMTYSDGRIRNGYWKKGQPVDDYGQLSLNGSSAISNIDDGTNIQSGCLRGDCDNGKGVFAYPEGSRYEGQFRNRLPDGYGTFYYANGNQYNGAFRKGNRHGTGTLVRENGSVLSGEWRYGEYLKTGESSPSLLGCVTGNCLNGYGSYLYKDGSKYTGTFKNGYPNGYGTVEYTDGNKYEGQMKDGAFDGTGTLYRDGLKITGNWQKGMYLGALASVNKPTPGGRPNLKQPKIWAVIVGIAAYNSMPTLRYTDDDAYRFYSFLKSPEGGALKDENIRILIDEVATKKNIITSMNEVFSKASEDDLVIMYFSGHGLKGSFLPIDYDGHNNKLYHSEIRDILEHSRAKLKLCLADACHSGSLLSLRSGNPGNQLEDYYNKLAQSNPGTVLIMSSKSDETSLESSGLRQGVFSHFLIRGLKGEGDQNKDTYVSVQELFDFIYFNVRSYTQNRQSPIIKGDYDPSTPLSKKR